MGLLDLVKAQLASVVQTQLTPLLEESPAEEGEGVPVTVVAHVVEVVKSQGLGSLLQKFQASGMGEAVASWVGTGSNLPISGEQIRQALGPEMIQQVAARVGIAPEQAATWISQVLPHAVDTLTPNGRIDDQPASPEPATEPTSSESEFEAKETEA